MTSPWTPPPAWEPPVKPWEPEDDTEPDDREFLPGWEPPYPPPSEYHLFKRDADDDLG